MRVLLAAATIFSATDAVAQAALRPQPSGRAIAEVVLAYPAGQAPAGAGNVRIRIDYGVPHLRGRTLHTGDLVPYDMPWRTGANALTTLETGANLRIGGVAVPTGNYVIFTLPTRSGWKLILQRSVGQSATAYDAANDIVRFDLRTTRLTQPIESFTIWLIPSTAGDAARGELRMAWGTVQLAADWVVTP